MDTFNFWHLLNVRSGKVKDTFSKTFLLLGGLIFLIIISSNDIHAQHNNWRYDLRRFNLGFMIGLNIADVKMYYGDVEFDRRTRKGLKSIKATEVPGINIGIITNLKIWKNLDLRFIPAVSLQQRNFTYFFDDQSIVKRLESSYVDLPLMIKFKSNYYAHHRVYVMTGLKYSWNLVSDKKVKQDPNLLKIDSSDLSWEFAFGIDIYGERVKLTPELRYSLGLRNIYYPDNTNFGYAIKMLSTQTIMICLNFE